VCVRVCDGCVCVLGAVQVDPRLTLHAFRDFRRLKLKHDKLLSNFAFNFNLRPSSKGRRLSASKSGKVGLLQVGFKLTPS